MKFYLAPMEGLTGYVYRNAHRACFGNLDRYFTPFLASKKLNSKEKREVLPENNQGIEVVPQILTNKPGEFIAIVKQLEQRGYMKVNLNLGCPSGTVTAKNRGAGFLKVIDELEKFLEEIFNASPLSISVKTRIGAYHTEEFTQLIELYNKFPIEELIVHPRLMTEFYNGTPHLEEFALAVKGCVHPLCYNGDVNTIADYNRITGLFPSIDRIMLGRGILANPGLVNEINGGDTITSEELKKFHALVYEGYKEAIGDERNTLFKMKELWVFMGKYLNNNEKVMKELRKSDNYMEYEVAVRNALKCWSVQNGTV